MKKMLAIKYYPLDCDELLSYTKHKYFWPRSLHLNYFEEPYIPPSRENCMLKNIFFLEKIQRFLRKLMKRLLQKKNLKLKIVEEINEDPIIEKDLEVEMAKTIEEDIKDESFKDLNEIKSYDC